MLSPHPAKATDRRTNDCNDTHEFQHVNNAGHMPDDHPLQARQMHSPLHVEKHHKSSTRPQKSTSRAKPFVSVSAAPDITPAFWYSPTRFSKKFVLPWRLMSSIQSNGLEATYSLECPRAVSRRSATNSMYRAIRSLFMPMRSHDSASQMKRRSTSTAPRTMSCTMSSGSLCSSIPYNRHANSACRPSSREINSFENVRPGIRPRFFNQ